MRKPSAFTVSTGRMYHNMWKRARHMFGLYGNLHLMAFISGAVLTVLAGGIGAVYGLGLGVDFVFGRRR